MNTRQDSAKYRQKKALFSQMLSVYGRKPVLEALSDHNINCFRLHLAQSNKSNQLITTIITLAQKRQIDIHYHDRQALSRISKNGKQDQGVCLDIYCPQHQDYNRFLQDHKAGDKSLRILALDRITNPQNLGMIIRSACAGNIDAIVIPEKGCAKLDSLVIKASAGTVFKAPLVRCQSLD
ncbi:MAG: RNA methyltransferase substrate-binding domain-containing protein, partial [Pseudomonadota bacterium]